MTKVVLTSQDECGPYQKLQMVILYDERVVLTLQDECDPWDHFTNIAKSS